MSNHSLFKKLKDHHQAALIAIFLVSCTAIFAIPDGVSLLDLSTHKPRSAVINSEGDVFKIYKWEFSVFINKTNNIYSFDKTYGLPDIVILDPGEHLLEVTCRGRLLNIGWVNSEIELKIEVEPNKVYKLVSRRASSKFGNSKCVVELLELDKDNYYQATDLQLKYLNKFGF